MLSLVFSPVCVINQSLFYEVSKWPCKFHQFTSRFLDTYSHRLHCPMIFDSLNIISQDLKENLQPKHKQNLCIIPSLKPYHKQLQIIKREPSLITVWLETVIQRLVSGYPGRIPLGVIGNNLGVNIIGDSTGDFLKIFQLLSIFQSYHQA